MRTGSVWEMSRFEKMDGRWKEHELYFGALYVGEVRDLGKYSPFAAENRFWRAWCSQSADGNDLGYYATEDAAKVALELWLVSALPKSDGCGNK